MKGLEGRVTDQDFDLELYKFYIDERTRLIASKQEQSKSYDQAILTFSAGAIGLSVTFITQLAPKSSHRLPLYVSWIGFALAILSVLLSFLASQRATEIEIERLDEQYRTGAPPEAKKRNRFSIATRWLNRLAVASFLAGVGLFTLFAAVNL
jgi:hypothetical protein